MIDLERVFVAVSEMLGDQDADVRIAALGALGSTARKVTHAPPAALTSESCGRVRWRPSGSHQGFGLFSARS